MTLLVALGIVMAVLTVWLISSTRPDRDALGPLELMGRRRWRSAGTAARRRSLDEVRAGDGASSDDDVIVEAAVTSGAPNGVESLPPGGDGDDGDDGGDAAPVGATDDAPADDADERAETAETSTIDGVASADVSADASADGESAGAIAGTSSDGEPGRREGDATPPRGIGITRAAYAAAKEAVVTDGSDDDPADAATLSEVDADADDPADAGTLPDADAAAEEPADGDDAATGDLEPGEDEGNLTR